MSLCDYGCGGEAHFRLKNGKMCCCEKPSSCEAVRRRNSESLKKAHKENRVSSFTDEARYKSLQTRKKESLDFFLKHPELFYSSKNLKRYLLEYGIPYKCSICGISSWRESPLTLEIDHIDGVRNHNNPDNLRFLCPNCHSQTDNWRGKNINSGKMKVSDEDFLKALKESKNIRQALIKVGLTPKGANYVKVNQLLSKIDNSNI